MLRRRTLLAAPVARPRRPRYSSAAPHRLTRARDVARAAHFSDGPTRRGRMPAEWVHRAWNACLPQPRAKPPPREPPLRLAFFSRLSYWCDIRWAWIWAMKSITTTTTINSEVPPK